MDVKLSDKIEKKKFTNENTLYAHMKVCSLRAH